MTPTARFMDHDKPSSPCEYRRNEYRHVFVLGQVACMCGRKERRDQPDGGYIERDTVTGDIDIVSKEYHRG